MTGQLRAGGLALIVGCVSNPVNIGKCVTLVKTLQPGEWYEDNNGVVKRYSMLGSSRGIAWLVFGDVVVYSAEGIAQHGHSLTLPEHLMPLDGPNVDFTNEARREWSDDAFLRIVRDLRDSLGSLKKHRNT